MCQSVGRVPAAGGGHPLPGLAGPSHDGQEGVTHTGNFSGGARSLFY